jgi:hypothetical protein
MLRFICEERGFFPPQSACIPAAVFYWRTTAMDEPTRQALSALYFAICGAAGGDGVLHRANEILTDAVLTGAVEDPYACSALLGLVRNSEDFAA